MLLLGSLTAACTEPPSPGLLWRRGPDLPQPITNNAVAAVEIDGVTSVFTFLGLDSTKVWSGVTDVAYRWDVGDSAWTEIAPVPGPGRLASTAQVVDGRIYVIGGYTVAEDGSERSLPDVAIYDPVRATWSRGADIPVPTDDAVAGVWNRTQIVLVSGWHDTGNVADVQLYDPGTNGWSAATAIPGEPVFGHTGAVVGDRIIYADGTAVTEVRPRFRIERASWSGTIDRSEPSRITWVELAPHPGPPLYRSAGGTARGLALFLGGSENPYNYDGIGYDGSPSEPVGQFLAYDPDAGAWHSLVPPTDPTMDHRNLAIAGERVFLVGGMGPGQVVSHGVWYANLDRILETRN